MIYQIQIVNGVKTLVPVTGDATANNIESGNLLPATSNAVANAIGWKALVVNQYRGTFTIPATAREVLITMLNEDENKLLGNFYINMAMMTPIIQLIIPCNNDSRSIWDVSNNGRTFTHASSSGNYRITVYYRDGVTLNSLPSEGEGGEATHYSTIEQFTGKYWIDGKPIYGIVIEGNSLPSSGTVFLSGIETLINQYGSYTSGGNQISLPYNSGSSKVELRVNSSNQLFLQSASVGTVTKYYFYAEYTKTVN